MTDNNNICYEDDEGNFYMFGHKLPETIHEHQASPLVHPYTCPNRGDGNHITTRDLGVLEVAEDETLFCPSCGYKQNWTHYNQKKDGSNDDHSGR